MAVIQRKHLDMDPVRPWVWASLVGGRTVEVVSYPIPREGAAADDLKGASIMVRLTPGDPGTLREVPFSAVACFDRTRHEWWFERERVYYGPNEFVFADAMA